MSELNQVDVLVIGGGMVGAVTALGCAQLGLSVALLEREAPDLTDSPHQPYQARVSALTRASENILRHLGAWSAIEQGRAHPFSAMRIWDAHSDAELVLEAQAIKEENLGHVVENQRIQAALWKQLPEVGVAVYVQQQLQDLSFQDDYAELVTDQGRFQAQLVVGADGAFSQARSLAGIGLDQHDYSQCAVVGCVRTQAPHQDACWQRYTAQGPFAFLAMEQNVSSIAWYLPVEKMDWALSLPEDEYRQALYQASDGRLGEIVETWSRGAFPLTRRHAQHYVKSRFALVGDAAHTVHPQAGQGVNLGLLDAAALVDVLGQACRAGEDFAQFAVLRRYERWRKGDNVIVQRAMEGFDWLFDADHGLKDALRARVLSLANLARPVKNQLIKQALYGREPLPALARKTFS